MAVSAAYYVAWLLPIVVGSGIWLALQGRANARGDLAAAIGGGWLIGIVVAAECARFAATAHTSQAFAHAWPWFAAIGVVAWIVAIVRLRAVSRESMPRDGSQGWRRWLWWLLLAWIVVRFVSIGDEASLRPVFPWDAWSAWSIKPKTWFYVGRAEPYVAMLDWLTHPGEALRTAAAWNYPELLAWIQLWFAGAAAQWNEPLVDLAWCGALAAFALAAYGYWRAIAIDSWVAIGLVYALVSLPLIDAHVALAGYADLWVALTLGFATLAWSRWRIRGERGQLALAILAALTLPAIKFEGMVWLITFAAVVALDLLPRRWRWRVVAAIVALLALGAVVADATGTIHLGWNRIDIPSLGTFALAWHGVGGAMLASLFTLPNWHLLWYVLPIVLALRHRRFRDDPAARGIGLLLLIDFAFLFALFFFTTASAWAQDFTSANRLILQLVPTTFVLIAVLLRPLAGAIGSSPRTARATAAPRVPA